MAQRLIRDFVADLRDAIDLPDPIVEFGALQVEPDQDGDLRPLFPGRAYAGTDFRAGPGVDRVEDLRALGFADGEVGTALCLDTLEHCEDPPQACRELHRVTADGGVCVLSSEMAFGIHASPSDYFRFTPEAFRSMLGRFDDVRAAGVGHPEFPVQVVGVGAKGRSLDTLDLAGLPSLVAEQARWEQARGRIRLGALQLPARDVAGALARELPRLARERLRGAR
jgi:hypothetical protein